jgi:hypothetical protein
VLEYEDRLQRPGLQYLTGIASSSINPIELGVRQTLTIDIAFSLWLALGCGNQPMIHPEKKVPYGWDEIAALVEVNPRTEVLWDEEGLKLKTFGEILTSKPRKRKSTVLQEEIGDAVDWGDPVDTNITVKKRNARLLRFDLRQLTCFGLAIRESRMNFYGSDQELPMRVASTLLGLGPSVLSKIERKLQNTLTLDNAITLLVGMGSGKTPPIHPDTSTPYDWNAIAGLLEFDDEIVKRWHEDPVVLKAGFKMKTVQEFVESLKNKGNKGTHETKPRNQRRAKLAI